MSVFFRWILKKIDCIVVGLGLAGACFSKVLEDNAHSFVVFENEQNSASKVALGVYNPVILKRFTPVWHAKEHIEIAAIFYKQIEKTLQKNYDEKIKIYRLLNSVAEQNNWFHSCDQPALAAFMNPKLIRKKYARIPSPYHFGQVFQTGRIHLKKMLIDLKEYYTAKNIFIRESFDYQNVVIDRDKIIYKNYAADCIVFCEGSSVKNNPFFNELSLLNTAKGELLTIYAPYLKLDVLINSGVQICPVGSDFYKVGATFSWNDTTLHTTAFAKKNLKNKLEKIIKTPYKIVAQQAGIRPTTKDRRPVLGKHYQHANMFILNGLGTRGVLLAPKMALDLYDFIYRKKSLAPNVDIFRFYKT